MKHIFITATGTDVGKTFVSSLLLQTQTDYHYWKPVQTGDVSDTDTVRKSADRIALLPILSYKLPASPDQAAEAEGRDAPTVKQILHTLHGASQNLLVEGAGGLHVPLNERNETWLDFLQQSRLPVLLVTGSGLGTLNHTMLSIEALQSRAIPILAVVVNGPEHGANIKSLMRMQPDIPFLALHTNPRDRKAEGEKIWRMIEKRRQPKESDWLAADKQFVWHPYTQHKTAPEPIAVVKGQGIYLETDRGEQLMDASASWWTCTIGHGHPAIGAAIRRQQAQLDHCGFGNATHEPGSRLAARLVALGHGQLQRVFYSDNGSCAVEVALKIAAQSWLNRGIKSRSKFLYFQGAYHGDTFGAMAVAESSGFHKSFSAFRIPGVEAPVVTAHPSRLCPTGPLASEQGREELTRLFAEEGAHLAGVIIEPMLQGASGMNVQDLAWLRHLSALCQKEKVPLILDEVFTGMGRTGAAFAFQRAGIEPDIVCMAKGLTGGNLPLAATLVRESLFEAFLDDDRSKALLHGHTFTGNPIACAAALATLKIYDEERLWTRALMIEESCQVWADQNKERLGLRNPRTLGGVLAFEVGGREGDYFDPVAYAAPQVGRKHGLLLRTLGSTLYLIPPLTISGTELQGTLRALGRTVEDLRNGEGISKA